jgi:hypothetical protein
VRISCWNEAFFLESPFGCVGQANGPVRLIDCAGNEGPEDLPNYLSSFCKIRRLPPLYCR